MESNGSAIIARQKTIYDNFDMVGAEKEFVGSNTKAAQKCLAQNLLPKSLTHKWLNNKLTGQSDKILIHNYDNVKTTAPTPLAILRPSLRIGSLSR